MTVAMSGEYTGNKKVVLKHEPSGSTITTVAPLDNNGDGTLFSPTDLFAVSFPTCVLTIMAISADAKGFSIAGAQFSLEKEMSANPRRVGCLRVTFELPASLSERERKICEAAIEACPVHRSLHPDITLEVTVNYV